MEAVLDESDRYVALPDDQSSSSSSDAPSVAAECKSTPKSSLASSYSLETNTSRGLSPSTSSSPPVIECTSLGACAVAVTGLTMLAHAMLLFIPMDTYFFLSLCWFIHLIHCALAVLYDGIMFIFHVFRPFARHVFLFLAFFGSIIIICFSSFSSLGVSSVVYSYFGLSLIMYGAFVSPVLLSPFSEQLGCRISFTHPVLVASILGLLVCVFLWLPLQYLGGKVDPSLASNNVEILIAYSIVYTVGTSILSAVINSADPNTNANRSNTNSQTNATNTTNSENVNIKTASSSSSGRSQNEAKSQTTVSSSNASSSQSSSPPSSSSTFPSSSSLLMSEEHPPSSLFSTSSRLSSSSQPSSTSMISSHSSSSAAFSSSFSSSTSPIVQTPYDCPIIEYLNFLYKIQFCNIYYNYYRTLFFKASGWDAFLLLQSLHVFLEFFATVVLSHHYIDFLNWMADGCLYYLPTFGSSVNFHMKVANIIRVSNTTRYRKHAMQGIVAKHVAQLYSSLALIIGLGVLNTNSNIKAFTDNLRYLPVATFAEQLLVMMVSELIACGVALLVIRFGLKDGWQLLRESLAILNWNAGVRVHAFEEEHRICSSESLWQVPLPSEDRTQKASILHERLAVMKNADKEANKSNRKSTKSSSDTEVEMKAIQSPSASHLLNATPTTADVYAENSTFVDFNNITVTSSSLQTRSLRRPPSQLVMQPGWFWFALGMTLFHTAQDPFFSALTYDSVS